MNEVMFQGMEQPAPAATPFRDVYTVSRLNREAKAVLETGFPPIWIEGEISNLSRPASGHVYFSLKDAQAQVRCAFFRQHQRLLGIALKDGLHVLARARVSLYEGRGDYQLIIEYLEEAGEGALRRAFDALKQRLLQEGLFDVAHKKPLPRLPRRLGIITSPSGAVLHDILTTLRRRFPGIAVLVFPVPVQGEGAAEKIAKAIRLAGERGDCDALILARGGGSLEDLWAFNEEIVARAIYACPIPVVSGVGHETDFTIADMVADARAPTPTAAAEMLSPDQQEWLAQFARFEARLATGMQGRLRSRQQHLDWLGRAPGASAQPDCALAAKPQDSRPAALPGTGHQPAPRTVGITGHDRAITPAFTATTITVTDAEQRSLVFAACHRHETPAGTGRVAPATTHAKPAYPEPAGHARTRLCHRATPGLPALS